MNFNKMKKKIFNFFVLALIFIVAAFSFNGCKKENNCVCLKRTGTIIKDVRHTLPFDEIIVEDNLKVFVIQDTFCEVTVQAGENLVSLIRTEVENGKLTITNNNRCNWTRSYDKPLNVIVRMQQCRSIVSNGTEKITGLTAFTTDTVDLETRNSGDIEFTVNNAKVRTHMFGYGDMTLHGITSAHLCSIGGDGYIYASDLHTPYTWIQTFTSGISYVYATDLLTCIIDKDGDVYCAGNPAVVEKLQNGSGTLHVH
jgi:hypothetical protein